MSEPTSSFLREAQARGYVHQTTDLTGLDAALAQRAPVPAYIGFDCTADSLHVGSLVSIMLLRRLQQHGHKPIVLMGGGTTKVGDPSFRADERPLLDDTQIQANMAGIKSIFQQFLTFGDGPTDAVMVNNDDWLRDLNYIAFLRDYGRHFSVNRMLSFDSVRLRLDREQPLSFLEFNYMILQAYDFLELWRTRGCRLQMGGSDQWGNIVNGIDLIRRLEGVEAFGLTTPLLTTASGQKMGKTASGAIWLNEANLSAYDYYQYWRNTEDADVGRFLRLFTELPETEIARLEAAEGAGINEAKKVLAFEATKLCRGAAAAEQAAETARRVFEQGTLGADLPRVEVTRDRLAAGVPLFELLREAGFAETNGEARRLIKGGGARINDGKIADPQTVVTDAALREEASETAPVIKISAGKKRHALVVPV
jgi:tyrosyl-tRNA synthetase